MDYSLEFQFFYLNYVINYCIILIYFICKIMISTLRIVFQIYTKLYNGLNTPQIFHNYCVFFCWTHLPTIKYFGVQFSSGLQHNTNSNMEKYNRNKLLDLVCLLPGAEARQSAGSYLLKQGMLQVSHLNSRQTFQNLSFSIIK